ncbi:hypothetical protein SAMN06298216_3495 [Spirosomataceae bacterium TFI 002]|nr:hypothetical protein SAMN06298216_3495 [Spirosomataceae bacterium TFI 002]
MKNAFIYSFLVISIALLSCEKEAPLVPNEEELITTVIYTLTPQSGGESIVMTFEDLDGDGGQAPQVSGGTFKAGTKYNGVLQLLDESNSPVEDISAEVMSEADEHQVFYQTSSTLNLTVSYTDMDNEGKPLGLKTVLAANTKSTGSLKVILKHKPNKSAANVEQGDMTNAGGETDIEVSFNVTIQ